MATLCGGDVLIETLAREGVSRVFSMPGGQFLPVYDSIRDRPDLELIVARQEGASALLAAGYALGSGGPAVVMSTVGAGVIYEAGGLLMAWRERLPVLSIAPQVQSYRMKPIQESLQACDQDELFRPFTKFRAIVYHYHRIPQLVRRALRIATAPEPGPAHLDVPVDVLFEYHRGGESELFSHGLHRFQGEVLPDEQELTRAVQLISSARRPLVLVGRGIDRARAGAEAMKFLSAAGGPALSSFPAFSAIASDYPGRLCPAPLWTEENALASLAETDLLILLEADEETARLALEIFQRNPALKVIQAAALDSAIDSVVPVAGGLLGTPKAALTCLTDRLQALGKPADRDVSWMNGLIAIKPRLEARALDRLGRGPRLDGILCTLEVVSKLAGPEDFVICEGAMAATAALTRLALPGLHGAWLRPDDDIPGAGMPLSLGIKAARPGSKIFLVSAAGLFKRHSREFQTASRYQLPVVSFLFQDQIKKPDEEVDFAALARSLGVAAESVVEPVEEITEPAVRSALNEKNGMLFDASH